MANLEARADKAVRDAVDAFMDGRLVPDFEGEIVFETKNSRYRLLDGVVFAAPDGSLVGAELVGWLSESARRCLIEWSWQPGARAVLVDRKRGRNIIVTSTTRLLHQEEQAPPSFQADQPDQADQAEPDLPHHNDSWSAPPFPDEPAVGAPFSPRQSPGAIIASTPPPVEARALAEPESEPRSVAPPSIPPPTIPRLRAPSPFASAVQVVVPAPAPSPARRTGVHAPPRPIAQRQGSGATPLPQARPLPFPAAPPRRDSPVPPVITSPPDPQASIGPIVAAFGVAPRAAPTVNGATMPADWELTSAEFEFEAATDEPPTEQRPQRGSPQHDAPRRAAIAYAPGSPPISHGLSEAELDDAADAMDPVTSEPFPLLRPAEPSGSLPVPRSAPRR